MPSKKIVQSSYQVLLLQIHALQARAEALRKKEMADVIAQAKLAIEHYGLTAADLGLGRKVGRPVKAAGKPGGNRATRKKAAVVKYRDGAGNTWVGMGKRPDWFKAALATGKMPEELLARA